METLLVGGHGTGKTTLIAKEIIPKLKNYLVLDFCNEYFQWIKDESKLKTFESGLMGVKLKE
jgi:predicted ABC-type sugar transport system permease subunit